MIRTIGHSSQQWAPKFVIFCIHLLFQHRLMLWKEVMCPQNLVILLTVYLLILTWAQNIKINYKQINYTRTAKVSQHDLTVCIISYQISSHMSYQITCQNSCLGFLPIQIPCQMLDVMSDVMSNTISYQYHLRCWISCQMSC